MGQTKQNKKSTFVDALFIDGRMCILKDVTTKCIYRTYVNNINRPPTSLKTWGKDYPSLHNNGDVWPEIFNLSFTITRETFLQSFQYRIINRIITCQQKLFEMKLVDSPICKYCLLFEDDIKHFFLFCKRIDTFWEEFFKWWNNISDLRIPNNYEGLEESVLLGFHTRGDIFTVLNYCVIHAKQHNMYYSHDQIHNNNSVNLRQYLAYLKSKLNIEKYICDSKGINCTNFDEFKFLYKQL